MGVRTIKLHSIDLGGGGSGSIAELSAYTKTTGFTTINGSAITSGGNMVLSGVAYSAGDNIEIDSTNKINVTGLSEYQTTGAMASYYTSGETNTKISDAVSGKADTTVLSGYQTTDAMSNYYTSGETNTAISDAVSGKADTTGFTTVNGSAVTGNTPITIVAPVAAGTAGQPLLSSGLDNPVWGSYKFSFITQAAYDALSTKDATTIYFIIG